jgi:hypothetical protein
MIVHLEDMGNNSKKPDDYIAKEKRSLDLERAFVAEEAPIEKENELVAIVTAASEQLPFSRTRSIALVATVAAAPFLSVRRSAIHRCI